MADTKLQVAETKLAEARKRFSSAMTGFKDKYKIEQGVRYVESTVGSAVAGVADGVVGPFDVGPVEVLPSLLAGALLMGAGVAMEMPDVTAFGHGVFGGGIYGTTRDATEAAMAEAA